MKVICSFKGISRKLASIFNQRTWLSKVIVEDLSLLFKISNIIVTMINWWNTRYFFCYLKKFSILTIMLWSLQWDPLTYSRFENKTVVLTFQQQLGDSACTEILEITEYLCYFENNTSLQYSSPPLDLLFCYCFMGVLYYHK